MKKLIPQFSRSARAFGYLFLVVCTASILSMSAITNTTNSASLDGQITTGSGSILTPAGNTITVNSTVDVAHGHDGLSTLREAINAANSNSPSGLAAGECAGGAINFTSDTIVFTVSGTINLTGALPSIFSDMSINGPGSGSLTVRRDTGGNYRILTINSGNITISGMTFTNGRTPDGVLGTGN